MYYMSLYEVYQVLLKNESKLRNEIVKSMLIKTKGGFICSILRIAESETTFSFPSHSWLRV